MLYGMLEYILATIPFMLILGLRHGLDADHITAIDNLVRLYSADRKAMFVGTGFSIGHSIAVVGEMVLIILVIGRVSVEGIAYIGSIIGIAALAVIGVFNIVATKRMGRNWSSILAGRVLNRIDSKVKSPLLSSMIVGMVFGLGFDTATQISALVLSAVASATLGIQYALLLALFFTIGMISVDTLDSIVLRNAFSRLMGKSYFKGVSYALSGAAIAVASLALYEIVSGMEIMNEWFGPVLTVSILSVSIALAFR